MPLLFLRFGIAFWDCIRNLMLNKNKELALELKVSQRRVDNIIHSLKENNKIERINGKRYGYWKIK